MYKKLIGLLDPIAKHHKVIMKIDMDAKYQTPYLNVQNAESEYFDIGSLENEIEDAFEKVGFVLDHPEEKDSTGIGFRYIFSFQE